LNFALMAFHRLTCFHDDEQAFGIGFWGIHFCIKLMGTVRASTTTSEAVFHWSRV
jgi:hypothetical protein